MSEKSLGFEIQMGEEGGRVSVGVKPPIPSEQLDEALANLPERGQPTRIINMRPGGNPAHAYTFIEFLQPSFGKYRNAHAEKAVEALKSALSHNGNLVQVDEEVKSLHGDNQLFE